MGGLGNQMFQYAAANAVAKRNNTALKIDTTILEENKKNPHYIVTHRDLDLDIFSLNLELANENEIIYFNGKKYNNLAGKIYNRVIFRFRKKNLIIEKGRSFNESVLKLGDNKCLVGAWQSEKYFSDTKEETRKMFAFREPVMDVSASLIREIHNCDSICLNVRRGDYVTSPIYSKTLGALGVEYYCRGIRYFLNKISNPKVFVFSDDLEWCKNQLHLDVPMEIVGHQHAGKKFGNYLQLMKSCKYFVIPNSSFGWWGAWLSDNPGKEVVAPEKWYKDVSYQNKDLIPESWIKL